MSHSPQEILERIMDFVQARKDRDESCNTTIDAEEALLVHAFHCVGSMLHVAETVLRALGASSVRFADARSTLDEYDGEAGRVTVESPIVLYRFPAGPLPVDEIDALMIEVGPSNARGWLPDITMKGDAPEIHAVLWQDGSTSDAEMFGAAESHLISSYAPAETSERA